MEKRKKLKRTNKSERRGRMGHGSGIKRTKQKKNIREKSSTNV